MLGVNIIVIGKLKESYLKDASAEYIKRLQAFCSLKIIELSESKLTEKPSQKEIKQALENESKEIQKNLQGYVIAMCIEGKQVSSEELSATFDGLGVMGNSSISIVIGSSFGLSDEIKRRADFKLSMSKMTFPHQLARVMLLEQVYRAFQISNGGKYHK